MDGHGNAVHGCVRCAHESPGRVGVRRRESVQFLSYGLDERHGGVLGGQVGVRADELGAHGRPVERARAQRPRHEHRLVRAGPRLARRQRPARTGCRRGRELVVVRRVAARVRRRLGPAGRTAAGVGRTPVMSSMTSSDLVRSAFYVFYTALSCECTNTLPNFIRLVQDSMYASFVYYT